MNDLEARLERAETLNIALRELITRSRQIVMISEMNRLVENILKAPLPLAGRVDRAGRLMIDEHGDPIDIEDRVDPDE
jgi:hypothetical protein